MKTVCVTGGAGFIGSAVIRYFISKTNYNIVNVDKLTYAGNLDSIKEINDCDRYYFEQIDICNAIGVGRVLDKYRPDIVMNLAAETHVDRSIDEPTEFIHTNIIGTYTLLEQCRYYWNQLDINKKKDFRFHQISTDEVFGDLSDSECLSSEISPYAPSSPYSATKASSDHLVRAWNRTYGLPVLITVCSNNYGPYQFPEKLIPHMIISALEGKPLTIYGDGMQVRDWVFVDDHVKALLEVIEKGKEGETYNISGNNQFKNIDIVEMICVLLDDLAAEYRPGGMGSYKKLIKFVKDRPGHDLRYALDAEKIECHINWKPIETLESGLRKTVEWYIDNKVWWEKILNGSYKLHRFGT